MRRTDQSLAKGLTNQTLRQAEELGVHAQAIVSTYMSKIGKGALPKKPATIVSGE